MTNIVYRAIVDLARLQDRVMGECISLRIRSELEVTRTDAFLMVWIILEYFVLVFVLTEQLKAEMLN